MTWLHMFSNMLLSWAAFDLGYGEQKQALGGGVACYLVNYVRHGVWEGGTK